MVVLGGRLFLISEVPLYADTMLTSENVLWTQSAVCVCGAEMCSGSKAGSYVRLIDFCITQLQVVKKRRSVVLGGFRAPQADNVQAPNARGKKLYRSVQFSI